MVNDTIADFLTRLRNGLSASKFEVEIQPNKMVLSLAKILKSEGFIDEINDTEGIITVSLNRKKQLTHLKRISKPSLRRYISVNQIPRPKSGLGMVILSTPKGVLTGSQARKQQVGGELICEIW